MPTKWQIQATNAAYQAIGQLQPQHRGRRLRLSHVTSVEPIGQEFEHQEACDPMARRLCVNGATYHEQQEAGGICQDGAIEASGQYSYFGNTMSHRCDACTLGSSHCSSRRSGAA
jgi:hypothetical protein